MRENVKRFWLRLGVMLSTAATAFGGISPALAADASGGGIDNAVDANGFQISTGANGTITIKPGHQVSIGGTDWRSGLTDIIDKYKGVAQGILAICAITSLVCFIWAITRLGSSTLDSAPHARKQAIMGLLVSGIALALFGGLSVVVAFFWNFL